MTKLHITGDIHGDAINRFSYRKHPEMREMDKTDIVFVLGDCSIPFGINFPSYWIKEYKYDEYQLEWLSNRPEQFIFMVGNHDDRSFIDNLPQIEKYDNIVRQMVFNGKTYNNIVYLDKPGVYEICGYSCLCIGGANSHDIYDGILDPRDSNFAIIYKQYKRKNKAFRVKDWTWWENEAINIEECEVIRREEDWNNTHFDLILTHDYPGQINRYYGKPYRLKSTKGEVYLDKLSKELSYNRWYFGHLHADMLYSPENSKICGLFESIISLDN